MIASKKTISNLIYFTFAVIYFIFIQLRGVLPSELTVVAFFTSLLLLAPKARLSRKNTPFILLIFILSFLFLATSVVNGFSPRFSYEIIIVSLLAIFLLLLFYTDYLLLNIESLAKAYRFYFNLLAILSIITILAFLLFYMGNRSLDFLLYIRGGHARMQGTFGNPNYYSFALLTSFIIAYLFSNIVNFSKIALTIVLLATLATLSRGAIVGLLAFFIVIYFQKAIKLALRFKIKISKRTLKFALLFLAALTATFIYLPEQFHEKFNEQIERRVNDVGGGTDARLSAIKTSIDSQLVTGTVGLLFGIGADNTKNYSKTGHAPHNTYIRILTEYGLLTFVGMLMLFLAIFILILKTYRFSNLNISLVASYIALLPVIFTNDYFLVRDFWIYLYLIILITYSSITLKQNSSLMKST